jgi:hypothetical protein
MEKLLTVIEPSPVAIVSTDTESMGIVETFINFAGRLDAKIVIVPTAKGNRNPDGSVVYDEEIEQSD